jgi:uncharacterized glyoxalase superfamily protein PhnB
LPVKPFPEGYPTVAPYILLDDAGKFITFMTTVFGAKIREKLVRQDGRIGHAELCIGDSLMMLGESPQLEKRTPIMLYIYVQDVDATFERAVQAGATVMSAPANQFYGDRAGSITEPCGNILWIATHVEDVSSDELQRRFALQSRS